MAASRHLEVLLPNNMSSLVFYSRTVHLDITKFYRQLTHKRIALTLKSPN